MRLGTRRRDGRPAPDLAEVTDAIDGAFGFLRDEYGFRRLGAQRDEGGVVVSFRGAATGVNVLAAPDSVGVTVGRLDRAGRMRAFERDDWSHWWWVIQDLVPARAERERLGRRSADIRTLLAEHAAALRAHGDGVLRGDFTSLAEVEWWEFRHD